MTAPPRGEYAAPVLDCDIVMKGGITSGVVYPGVVDALARRYRFRSIGGTSAGAIAAAVVAAAEHSPDRAGFAEVADLPGELGEARDGRALLRRLFQPETANRALFSALLGFLERGKLRGALGLLRAFPRFPLIALVAVVLVVALGAPAWVVVLVLALAVAVVLGGVAFDVFRAALRLAQTDFGLCRLGPGVDATPALTPWLHGKLQRTAGREGAGPLTFAQLWGVPDLPADPSDADRAARLRRMVELSLDANSRTVDLQMMTTDLTHGRPMRLPAVYQRHNERLEEGGGLFFEPGELAHFFPADVIAHLESCAAPVSEGTAAELARAGAPATLRHFPIGPDLPVVVATRMSLSFPVLIAAIPLYELRFRAGDAPPVLSRVMFSDGGITSNFPVHFFDSPLPTRPTFALDLTGFPPGEGPDRNDPSRSVADPAAVNAPEQDTATEITTLMSFFTALKDAGQNWRDNAQARLPGFRERVVHIRLAAGEGGLNLTMPADKIAELSERGAYAGGRLLELFSGPPGGPPGRTPHWNDSRFARYRVAMSLTERWLRGYLRGYRADPDRVTMPYPDRVRAGIEPPYRFPSQAILDFAEQTTAEYLGLVDGWTPEETLDGEGVPRPATTLRAVPPV
jgi:predicted acylesterase/phospholipase RssA